MPRKEPDMTRINYNKRETQWETSVEQDDTTTVAKMRAPGYTAVFEGVARRRKGDPRNGRLGHEIAMARMFRDASDRYAEKARRKGIDPFPEEGPEQFRFEISGVHGAQALNKAITDALHGLRQGRSR